MSIKGKLIGLFLLMSLVLGLLAGYLLWASFRIRQQVDLFIPAISGLRGVADARINITRQMKEVTDYLVSASPEDRRAYGHFAAATRTAFDLWITSSRNQEELGVPGEAQDLERAVHIREYYEEWELLVAKLFSMTAAGRREAALRLFADRSDQLIEAGVLAGIDRALEDGLNEVQDAYNELLMSIGLIPWLAEDGLHRIRGTQASIEYLMAVNRVSAGVNKQIKSLLDYLLLGGEHDMQFFADYGKDTKSAIEACARAANRKAALDPANKAGLLNEVMTIERSYGQVLALAEKAINLKRSGRTHAALELVVTGLDPLLDAGLMPKIALALDDGGKEILTLSATASRQGVIAVILVSLFLAAGCFRLIQVMLTSLARLRTGIETIGKGDLDYRIKLGTSDEFGELATSINTMAGRLQESRADFERLNLELERRVEERTQQLETANQGLESFSYSVSHDLRAPLSRISALCQLFLEGEDPDLAPAVQDALRRIGLATQEMELLIASLLSLSQVASGEISRGRIDLSALVQTLAEELRQRDLSRQIEFHIAPGVSASGDRDLLLVALANLLGNAWKFTARRPVAVIAFGVIQRGGQRAFFVRDNGAGFDLKHAEKLFTPFHRLHKTEEFDGTGIGLATVQRIIQRHGGEIWAEGAVDAGATFFFTLGPLAQPLARVGTRSPILLEN